VWGEPQIKMIGNFWGLPRASLSSAAEAQVSFVKILRILSEIHSNFVQYTPPSFTFSEIERGCLGASRLGMVFPRENPSIFEGKRKRPLGNAEVRTNLFEKISNPFGIFLLSVFFFDYPKTNFKTIWTT